MIERVSAARVTCGHDDGGRACGSLLYADGGLDDAAVRAAVRERGWQADEEGGPVRCPKHAVGASAVPLG